MKIHTAIQIDIEHTGEKYNEIIYLGDYIDRGLNSKSVLDFLMSLKNTSELKHVFILGNHETFMTDWRTTFDMWMFNGGSETLASFGIGGLNLTLNDMKVLDPYIEWMQSLPLYYKKHNIIFCHSGYIKRDVPLDNQRETLLWGRPSRGDGQDYDYLVVHGHTPTKDGEPYFETNRICIDTGGWIHRNNWMHACVLPDKPSNETEARCLKVTV